MTGHQQTYSPIKVLLIDIETAPAQAYIWDLRTRYVPADRIVEPGYTLCFAAKWEGQREVMFHSLWTDGEKKMIKAAHKLMDEADVIVHYNGNKFDTPHLQRDFLAHGLGPTSPATAIDLFRTVKSEFKFMSSGLNYVSKALGIGSKTKHKGMELWTEVMDGDEKAQRIMERYNKQDVRLLERLYKALQPWIKNHPNRGLWMEPGENPYCPSCGSQKLRFKGYKRTLTLQYKQYHCKNCGAYPRARFSEKPTRHDILRP